MEESDATYQRVLQKLEGIDYSQLQHPPTRTSEESAAYRGTTLASGAKAMLIRSGNIFLLAVMAAHRKLDWKPLKRVVQSKNVRFATEEEVFSVTGCVPGAVPPFGSLFGLQTLVDVSLREQGESINFNAGLRTQSVSMSYQAYEQLESPTLAEFTKA